MNSQLPKVEIGPQEGGVHEQLDKAYEGNLQSENTPVRKPEDLLRAGGSVGVEAGLTDFEAISEDRTTDDTSSDGQDDTDNTTAPVVPTAANVAIGGVAVAQTPVAADDKDDIEKEWVSKAKRIVEQTKSDPYLQERAVSRLQADYMKKRFNKDVKLSEGDG